MEIGKTEMKAKITIIRGRQGGFLPVGRSRLLVICAWPSMKDSFGTPRKRISKCLESSSRVSSHVLNTEHIVK